MTFRSLPYETEILPFEGRMPNLAYGQEEWVIEKAAKVIDQAARPVILAGFGARGQGNKLLKLASKISAPIITTFRAKGVVDENEPLDVGCHGGVGSTAAGAAYGKSRFAHSHWLLIFGFIADSTRNALCKLTLTHL